MYLNIKPALLTIFSLVILTSCYTLVLPDGTKYHATNLAKDTNTIGDMDTSKFVRRPFSVSDYINKQPVYNGKRIVVPVRGYDLKGFEGVEGKHYVYMINPTCPGSIEPLRKLDSLSREGYNVMIVSSRMEYDLLHKRYDKTSFKNHPIYVIEADDYTQYLLWRKAGFGMEACPECYKESPNKSPLHDLILVDNGKVSFIKYGSEQDILR